MEGLQRRAVAAPRLRGLRYRNDEEDDQEQGIAEIAELRRLCLEAGADLIGYQKTVDLFGYGREEFIPEMKDFVGASTFLAESRDADVNLFI